MSRASTLCDPRCVRAKFKLREASILAVSLTSTLLQLLRSFASWRAEFQIMSKLGEEEKRQWIERNRGVHLENGAQRAFDGIDWQGSSIGESFSFFASGNQPRRKLRQRQMRKARARSGGERCFHRWHSVHSSIRSTRFRCNLYI